MLNKKNGAIRVVIVGNFNVISIKVIGIRSIYIFFLPHDGVYLHQVVNLMG